MTNKQESKYSMKQTVLNLFNKNTAITSRLPGFSLLLDQFSNNLLQIDQIRKQQEVDKTAVTVNKDSLKLVVASKAFEVGRKTEVYARMTNNTIMAKEMHFSETELKKAPDSKLKDRAQLIYDNALAHLDDLAEYGVDSNLLVLLKTAIDDFGVAIPSTRISQTESKQVTDKLAILFKANDELLEKFDLLVEIIRFTDPSFYQAYKDCRKVIDTGVSTLDLVATITDAASGEGLKGVKVTFLLQNGQAKMAGTKNMEPLVKVTADKGIFRIKNMDDGTYTVTIEKTGYKTQMITLDVADGDMAELVASLERN